MAESKTSGATVVFGVAAGVFAIATGVTVAAYLKLRKTVMDWNKANNTNIGNLGKSA